MIVARGHGTRSQSIIKCPPDCIASRVGNKNFAPAVKPYERVKEFL